MNIVNWAIDSFDERDYNYRDIFMGEIIQEILDDRILLDNVEYQNQWLEDITKMMCVYYSTWHWNNEENFQEWSDIRINNKEFWLKAKELWRLSDSWALISDWPRTARDLWYISWWALINTIDDIKYSLSKNRPVIVWSNKINWSTWNNKPFVLSWPSWSWHAIAIIGYDDNYEWWSFIIKQSYWKNVYDWWKQYLKYIDFNLLYNWKYSLIDSIDPILDYKKRIMDEINIPMAKVWYELWIWNWKDSTNPVTREEDVTISLRLIQKLLNWEVTLDKLNELIEKYWA